MKLLATAAALLFAAGAAQAATLDFSAATFSSDSSMSLPGATVVNTNGFGLINVGDAFCARGADNSCAGDSVLTFTQAVKNLTFNVLGYQEGDSVLLTIYGAANAVLGTRTFTSDQSVDLTSLGSITSLSFDDSSTAAGLFYTAFTYDLAGTEPTPTIPVPASLPLLAAGLAGLAALRRRKA